jgi:serine/threonine protein kinase
VCHRDINPNNIIINYDPAGKDHLKLTVIDFNVSKRFKHPASGSPLLMMTNTGTAKYQAPEMLQGWMSYYDEKIDLWSAGAVLYYMLTGGIHAFNFDKQKDIENAINEGDYGTDIPEYAELAEEHKILIKGLLTVDTDKRFTVA